MLPGKVKLSAQEQGSTSSLQKALLLYVLPALGLVCSLWGIRNAWLLLRERGKAREGMHEEATDNPFAPRTASPMSLCAGSPPSICLKAKEL